MTDRKTKNQKLNKSLTFLTAALVIISSAASLQTRIQTQALAPTSLGYQGILRNSGQAPLSGGYDFMVRYYGVQTGGSVLYSESFSGVSVSNGSFFLSLGSGLAVAGTYSGLDFNTPIFVSFDTKLASSASFDGEMTPRISMAASPYSNNTQRVQGRGIGGNNGLVTYDGAGNISTINLNASGLLIAGTNNIAITNTLGYINASALQFADSSIQVINNGLKVKLNSNGALVSDANGVGLRTNCNTGELLKWTGSSWSCGIDNDNQTLSLIGNNLSITNGNTLTLPANTGPQGPIGQTGVAGATGLQGVQGIAGTIGATGAQGPKGDQGTQGLTGATGMTGLQGIIGATGLQGIQGLTGNNGATGDQGLQGLTGAQGLKGDKGDTGLQGLVGAQGLTGLQGLVGLTGATGPQGIQGLVGATGLTGAQGIQGLTGLTGASGAQGPISLTGSQGIQGFKGDTGEIGLTGATGLTGAQGIIGLTGATGQTGAQGIQGIEGPKGDQGLQGLIGLSGIQGLTGATGLQGLTGSQGIKGDKGDTGLQGLTGSTGPQGIQGIAGVTNIQTANNGLTLAGSNLQLGGVLTSPTTIATNAVNTLTIAGLQAGSPSDKFLVQDANGILKTTTLTASPITVQNINSLFSTGLPQPAGAGATDATNAIFLGSNAGLNAASAYESNFLGSSAGAGAAYSFNSNFIGTFAGSEATDAWNSNFLGYRAGLQATNAYNSNFFGYEAGLNATNSDDSNFFGASAGSGATEAYESNFIGMAAGQSATNARNSIFLGARAGYFDTVNNFATGGTSILIGDFTNTGGFSDSIAIGKSAVNTKSNQFKIAPSYNNLSIGGVEYVVPNAQATAAGQMLSNDGTGILSWATITSLTANNGLTLTGSNLTLGGALTSPTVIAVNGVNTLSIIGLGTGSVSDRLLTQDPVTGELKNINSSVLASPITIYGVNSLFSTGLAEPAGIGAFNTYESIFLGSNAGSGATYADYSIFLGLNSGQNAPYAFNSNFFGGEAGNGADNAESSNFLGYGAGRKAKNANGSNFLGVYAGESATNAPYSNFIGTYAGEFATNANNSNFFGRSTGEFATNANNSTFIGDTAGYNASNANNSTFIGRLTGQNAINANNSLFLGKQAGYLDTVNNSTGGTSILIGDNTNTGGFSNSIALGKLAVNTKSNQFKIAPSYNNLSIGGVEYIVPNAQATTAGQVLTNDGNGTLSWSNAGSGSSTASNGLTLSGSNLKLGGTLTQNTTIDGSSANKYNLTLTNTNINLDKTTNGASGVINVGGARLLSTRGVGNLFLGTNSGNFTTFDLQGFGERNTGIGDNSLTSNISGFFNTALGNNSLRTNQSGVANVAVGTDSLFSNTFGGQNIAIGNRALYSNISGLYNIAIGDDALSQNQVGFNNTIVGTRSGNNINPTVRGNGNNTFVGSFTGSGVVNGLNNTFVGANISTTDVSNNIILADGLGNQRLNIIANGNTGFGITTPTNKLTVQDLTTTNVAKFNGSASTQCTIVTGTGLSCSSDARLKQGITGLSNATSIINGLKPVTYQWNGGSDNQYGFIAQDVQSILPDLVTTNSDGYLSLSKDEILPFVVKSIQETNARIDGLTPIGLDVVKSDIETLKTKVANLEATSLNSSSQLSAASTLTPTQKAIIGLFEIDTLGKATIKTSLKIQGDLEITGNLKVGSDTAFSAKVLAGQTFLRVTFDKPLTKTPIISLTPNGIILPKYGIENKTLAGFDIVISEAQTKDIMFDVIVLETK